MSSPIVAAFVGCGMFARHQHVPNMAANPKYKLYAACDIAEDAARGLCEDFNMEYHTTDLNRVLQDPAVELVVICTRHDQHAPVSIAAAKAGKHVLCEKPMGLNITECREIAEAVKAAGVKYTVGYNRGMSPLIVKSRELLAPLDKKKLIYHRIQAPFPVDHWTHIPEVGGGRFVGEGCHIFDLLCELVDSPPVSVYASGGIFLPPEQVKIPDSGIITITFADGSVGSTLIASDGCPWFPKEATEIYCDSKAIYIEDFREMKYFGFNPDAKEERLTLHEADKGQKREIDLLAEAIRNDTVPPNGLNNAARAALISFLVCDSIREKRPVEIKEPDYKF